MSDAVTMTVPVPLPPSVSVSVPFDELRVGRTPPVYRNWYLIVAPTLLVAFSGITVPATNDPDPAGCGKVMVCVPAIVWPRRLTLLVLVTFRLLSVMTEVSNGGGGDDTGVKL